MANEITKVLEGLKSDDLRIDTNGKVIIVNTKINDMLKDLGLKLPIDDEAIKNIACCENGYQCGCTAKATDFGERLVGKKFS